MVPGQIPETVHLGGATPIIRNSGYVFHSGTMITRDASQENQSIGMRKKKTFRTCPKRLFLPHSDKYLN